MNFVIKFNHPIADVLFLKGFNVPKECLYELYDIYGYTCTSDQFKNVTDDYNRIYNNYIIKMRWNRRKPLILAMYGDTCYCDMCNLKNQEISN